MGYKGRKKLRVKAEFSLLEPRSRAGVQLGNYLGAVYLDSLFGPFVTSSILGGASLPVVPLMISASFAANNLSVGCIVFRAISAYSTGLF